MTREMGKERGRVFDGGMGGGGTSSPPGKPLWVHITGLLMFKWQGPYLHSDMLSHGEGKKRTLTLRATLWRGEFSF